MTQLLIPTAMYPFPNPMGGSDSVAATQAGLEHGHGSLNAIMPFDDQWVRSGNGTRLADRGDRTIIQHILLLGQRLKGLDLKQRSRRLRCSSTVFKQR